MSSFMQFTTLQHNAVIVNTDNVRWITPAVFEQDPVGARIFFTEDDFLEVREDQEFIESELLTR